MVVYTPECGSEYGELAERIAREESTEVMTDLRIETDETIFYVARPDALDEDELLELQRRLLNRGPEDGRFSVVTGLSVERAEQLYDATPSGDAEHAIVLRREDRDRHTYDDSTVLTREGSTVENLTDLNERGLESLSFMINSRSIHGFLTGGYICGYPQSVSPSSFGDPQPGCVADGEMSCPLDGEIIRAETLTAEHVFLNSCMSMVPSNSATGMPVHVGMGILAGTTSLIGGYRPMDGIPQEALLHYCLLKAGYDATERCYLLNENAHTIGLKSYPYVVFGRPDQQIAESASSEYNDELRRSGDTQELVVHDVDSYVIDVEIPIYGDRTYLRNRSTDHTDAPLFYTAIPNGDTVRLLIYSWGPIHADRLTFSIHERPGSDEELLTATYRNARGADTIGLLDNKSRGQIKNLGNKLTGVPELRDRTRYDTNAYKEYEHRLESCRNDVENITDRIIQLLANRGPGFLSEEYSSSTSVTSASEAPDACPNCGRPVFVKRSTSPLEETTRVRGICPKCINVFDVPDGEPLFWPKLEGDLSEDGNDAPTIRLSFHNQSKEHMYAVFFPWLCADDEAYRDADVFEPKREVTEIPPGERHVASFEVAVEQLPDDGYPIYGYVVANAAIYMGANIFEVGNPDISSVPT